MKYEVRTERQWLLPCWGQKRVVHNYQRSAGATQRCKLLDVGDAQQRIAGRFDPQQIGRLGKRSSHGSIVTEIDEFDLPFTAAVPCVEQAIRPAITVVRRDDPGTGGNEIPDQ